MKCKVCKAEATLKTPVGGFCNYAHAIEYAKTKQEAARKRKEAKDKQTDRAKKQALKTRSEWLKEAQAEFNRFIRLRDADFPCISCGRHHQGQYHAGHYLSVGACPELRFTEENCHKQCAPCNNHLSGNIVNYRKSLIEKSGQEIVDWLEGPHEPLKLTIYEIKEIKARYRAKAKELAG